MWWRICGWGKKMTKTAVNLTPAEMMLYRTAAQQRAEAQKAALMARRERAWELARQAGEVLRTQFNIARVAIFGSLINPDRFHRWSDVDLAVWGLAPDDYFRAVGMLLDMSSEIEVNLVDVTACSASLLATIEREGIEL
jgi:predicted nucleotidyltransferase